MKNTINFLRVLNSIVSLGLMGYVGYKYAKQCGDIEKLKEKAEATIAHYASVCEKVANMKDLDKEYDSNKCDCEPEPETPSEPVE